MKRRHFRDRFRELLKFDEPARKLALAFGLGTFIAFSPWLGLHILSAVLLAWLFRLNKVVVLTASLINNPWTIVPIYAFCLWLGIKITGSEAEVPPVDWRHLGFHEIAAVLEPFLLPYMVGTLVVGAAASITAYYLFYRALKRYRSLEAAGAAADALQAGSPEAGTRGAREDSLPHR